MELVLSDPLTRAQVLAIRPGATDAEMVIERPPPATPQEEAELRRLVNFVLTEPEDRAEAMQVGLADIKNALVCYRLLAEAAAGKRAAQAALNAEALREAFDERAAILEYDAGLPRVEAEQRAAQELGMREIPAGWRR